LGFAFYTWGGLVRRFLVGTLGASALAALFAVTPALGEPLSGTIFTTDATGRAVNLNIYAAKADVYLNGGPEKEGAAGLPAGDYYFQVTDPSGKTLLSADDVECRRFTVDASGRIVTTTCHATGLNEVDGGVTVQLAPYLDTPNSGGLYKVWVTPVERYDPLAPGSRFGFVPRDSKTDDFQVRDD
jgi:hypothetical protein